MDKSSTPNNARALWEAFQQTGRVSAYIAYRSALRRERETENGGGPATSFVTRQTKPKNNPHSTQ